MLALDTAGVGSPLVLLHGVGTSRVIWRRAREVLAADHFVVAPDLPGFGASPPAGEGFDLDEVADALCDGLADVVEPPFDLVGNSLGGAIALTVALRRPELLSRLVLSAPAGFSPRDRTIARVLGVAGEGLIQGRRLLSPLAASGLGRRALLWGAIADPSRVSEEDAKAMLEAPRGATRIGAAIEAVIGANLLSRLDSLEVPLGLIWGTRDRVIPIATLERILDAYPDAPVERIEGAGHVPQMECPREYATALERLLADLAPVTNS